MKIIDLTGMKFGRLTVIGRAGYDRRKKIMWACKCGCPEQTETVVIGSNLRNGMSKSCGCLKVEKFAAMKTQKTEKSADFAKSLIGKKFGEWMVIAYVGINSKILNSLHIVKCKCGCSAGTVRDIAVQTLIKRRSTSCGCYSAAVRQFTRFSNKIDDTNCAVHPAK